jgi:tetratricopeptide (TPR) repeat protein
MVRRAFVPPPTLELDSAPRTKRGSMAPSFALRPQGASFSRSSGVAQNDERRSSPPSAAMSEAIPAAACAQLLDRLAAADQAPFVASWIENLASARGRLEPALAVRLLRSYRESGRLDRARELAASLPSTPTSWLPLDVARLAIERAVLALGEGRRDHASAELRLASRALSEASRGTGLREQLDIHLAQAQLDAGQQRLDLAAEALRLSEHVAERIEDGGWRAPVAMTLGHLSMRLADPRGAAKQYATALVRVPARGALAMTAHANLAIALGSMGRFDEGRHHALQAIGIACEVASPLRHADAHDVLAILEIAADQPHAALNVINEAFVVLGDLDHPMLRYQLTEHRAWALAMLGRPQAVRQWLAKAEKLRSELGALDPVEDQELVAIRARTLECCGQVAQAFALARKYCEHLPEAFVTGAISLVVGRCALALGDDTAAREAVERAALAGDRHGWVFPDRQLSSPLWQVALRSGDSRVVRYAERMIALTQGTAGALSVLPLFPSTRPPATLLPPSSNDADASDEPASGEVLVYLTTSRGVTRVALSQLAQEVQGIRLVVNTLAHALYVDNREVSLERRRALEPLVVQLLRRAREGLSAEEILHAAGGPGPESADAEHRVRVLISRVRDLIGNTATIERVRDAGEHGKTRYRLAASVPFALVEPLFAPTAP